MQTIKALREARAELTAETFVDALKEAPYVVKVLARVVDMQLDAMERLTTLSPPSCLTKATTKQAATRLKKRIP